MARERSNVAKSGKKSDRIANLGGIDLDDVNKLHAIGIFTFLDLWSAVGKDFDRGIDIVANEAGLAPEQLIRILVAAHDCELKQNERGIQRYWPEVALVVTVIALLALAFRAAGPWS
jgi:hypothetical protein